MRSIDDLDVAGARVLLRADLNVPLEDGRVVDDTRIRAALPTIEELRGLGATIVLASHLGRPHGPDPALSLRPVGERLQQLTDASVMLAPGVVGEEVSDLALGLGDGQILLLENPVRPLVAVLGGAKVADKIGVVRHFLHSADRLLIGGAMAFPFLAAAGHDVGASRCAPEDMEVAAAELAGSPGDRLESPRDLVVARSASADAPRQTLEGLEVPDGWLGLDIGPHTAKLVL
jgi:3-phosphoglycerate kinase